MKRLSLLDLCFLKAESAQTPMHVGVLLTFKLPPSAGADYLSQRVERLRRYPVNRAPFNHRLKQGLLGRLIPTWEQVADVDLDYHLRHSALPKPGGERELGVLISRLHSHPLNLARPPWEVHVIEGLENKRFALYFKGHHSAIDGMGGMRLLKGWLTEDARDLNTPAPWALPEPEPAQAGPVDGLRKLLESGREQFQALQELYQHLARAATEYPKGSIGSLFKAPHSPLNSTIDGQRRFATQSLSLARIDAVAAQSGASQNDVVLAICGGALRRYLLELDALPKTSLISLVPVAQRPRRGQVSGNSICGLLADLETQLSDPIQRLQAIRESTTAGKAHLQRMSRMALNQYSLMLMLPLTLSQITRVTAHLPPLFNLIVSNVPGPRRKLHLDGAELEGIYPVSVLFRGQALNITVLAYGGRLNFCFTACRDAVPSVQRLAVYAGDALNDLEQALSLPEAESPRVVSIHRLPPGPRRRSTLSADRA